MEATRKKILEVRRASEKRNRKCMFMNCKENAIKSHVLQKNGILREISENNHLIELVPSNPFEFENKGISDFKLVGINDVYTFHGFCQKHDSVVFKLIEVNHDLNFHSEHQQALFCYRGLCQEIRRKEIASEWLFEIKKSFPEHLKFQAQGLQDGFKLGIKNLGYFKKLLEYSINYNKFDSFHFETLKVPKIDLCISVPLNVGEFEKSEDGNYEKWKKKIKVPFTTSFMNVFPKRKHTYIICGYHKKFPCQWTINFIERIKKGTKESIFKEISDLLTLRLEFWAMSPALFKSIEKKELEKYKFLFKMNAFNHSEQLETDLNLFENI